MKRNKPVKPFNPAELKPGDQVMITHDRNLLNHTGLAAECYGGKRATVLSVNTTNNTVFINTPEYPAQAWVYFNCITGYAGDYRATPFNKNSIQRMFVQGGNDRLMQELGTRINSACLHLNSAKNFSNPSAPKDWNREMASALEQIRQARLIKAAIIKQ